MKKNLIKILAISTLVFGLGACNFGQPTNKSEESSKQESSQQSETSSSESQQSESSESSEEEALEATISELLDLNAQGKWALEGKKVVIKNLAVAAFYGNTLIGSTALGDTVNTLRAIQINYDEIDPLPEGARNIFAAEITAEGVLEDEEGHPVINNAKVTITNARLYDDDGNRVPDTGASVYYWNNFSRSGFGGYVGRSLSFPTRGTYQLASLPGELSTDEEATFEVVFPGENLDTEDLDNDSLITCYVPAGLAAGQVSALNAFFADAEVGDGVDMFAITYFNYTVCGGAGFLIDSYWAELAEAELDIQQTWAEVTAKVQDNFADPIPDMGYDEKAISYLVDFDPADAPDDVLNPDYIYVDEALWPVMSTATFTINFKSEEDSEAAAANIASVLEAAGWAKELDEDGAAGYVLVDNEKTVAQALYEYDGTQITIYYIAHDETVGYASAAEIMDIYEGAVNELLTALEATPDFASLIDLTTTAEAASFGYMVDVSSIDGYAAHYGSYGLLATASLMISFNSQDDAVASANEIYAALLGAGFVDSVYNNFLTVSGLYNATSHEFVQFSLKGSIIKLEVVAMDAKSESFFIDDAVDMEGALYYYNDNVGYYMAKYESLGFSKTSALPAFTFGEGVEPDAIELDFSVVFDIINAYGVYIMEGDMSFYFNATEEELNGYAAAYVAALAAAGFVEAESLAFGVDGMYNETTGEFVYIGVDADYGLIEIDVLVHATSAQSYVNVK